MQRIVSSPKIVDHDFGLCSCCRLRSDRVTAVSLDLGHSLWRQLPLEAVTTALDDADRRNGFGVAESISGQIVLALRLCFVLQVFRSAKDLSVLELMQVSVGVGPLHLVLAPSDVGHVQVGALHLT